jgi:hypothetical protein
MFSCKEKNKLDVDVSGIETQVEFIRFNREFFGQSPTRFPEIKNKYPYKKRKTAVKNTAVFPLTKITQL